MVLLITSMDKLIKDHDGVYDVQDLVVPVKRHRQLIALFKGLKLQEGLTFINDHDPPPLHDELKSVNGDVLGWGYPCNKSHGAKVKITRTEHSSSPDRSGIEAFIDLSAIDAGH